MDYLQTEVVTMLQRRAEELQLGPEAHAVQLEALGFSVGQKLAERMVKERAPFQTLLDVIKFIGREFWTEVFKKQLDKLQTNHNVSLQPRLCAKTHNELARHGAKPHTCFLARELFISMLSLTRGAFHSDRPRRVCSLCTTSNSGT
jgi:hypothetical protein